MSESGKQVVLHAVVTGRVQGVGFRYFTTRAARRCRLTGWVQNNADGTVSLEAIGDEASLNAFLQRIRQGPPSSRVDGVQVRWNTESDSVPVYLDFEVR